MSTLNPPISKRRWLAVVTATGLLALGGCATKVQNPSASLPAATAVTSAGPTTLPLPPIIYVQTFALDPATVQLDAGIRARLKRSSNGDGAETQQQLASDVQGAISNT